MRLIRSWNSRRRRSRSRQSETIRAESKRDFRHKISLRKKESSETKYWLEMLSTAESKRKPELRKLWQEAKELTLIFAAILRKGKRS